MTDRLWKNVEIGEDQYRIKKFTALTGAQVARRLLALVGKIDPRVFDGEDGIGDAAMLQTFGDVLGGMSDTDVEWLMKTCMRQCYKDLPAGPHPVINDNGSYGVPEVEYDLMLSLRLVWEAVKWGASGFFGASGSPSAGTGETLSNMFRQVLSKSMNTSTPPSPPDTGGSESFGTEPTPWTT